MLHCTTLDHIPGYRIAESLGVVIMWAHLRSAYGTGQRTDEGAPMAYALERISDMAQARGATAIVGFHISSSDYGDWLYGTAVKAYQAEADQ